MSNACGSSSALNHLEQGDDTCSADQATKVGMSSSTPTASVDINVENDPPNSLLSNKSCNLPTIRTSKRKYSTTITIDQDPSSISTSIIEVGKRIRPCDSEFSAPSHPVTPSVPTGSSVLGSIALNLSSIPSITIPSAVAALQQPAPFGPSVSVLPNKLSGDFLEAEPMTITVRPLIGESFVVSLPGDCALYDLKDVIGKKLGVPYESQILSLAGRTTPLVNEDAFLDELGIVDGSLLNLSIQMVCGMEAPTFLESPNDIEDELSLYELLLSSACGEQTTIPNSHPIIANACSTIDRLTREANSQLPLSTQSPNFPAVLQLSQEEQGSLIEDTALEYISSRIYEKKLSSPLESLDALNISIASDEDDSGMYSCRFDENCSRPLGSNIFFLANLAKLEPEEAKVPLYSSLTGSSACAKCRRKCRIAQRFECRCGKTFCPTHRYPDQHDCNFDHQSHGLTSLKQSNPKIVKPKIDSI